MKVPDTPENMEICKQYCGTCPTFRENKLMESEPHLLFCARGVTTKTDAANKGCKCLECPIPKKHGLNGGWFCFHAPED